MSIFGKIWAGFKKGWMKFAHTLGRINTTILLSIVYFVIVGVYSIISRFFKLLLFPFKRKPSSYWIEKKENSDSDFYKHPF